MHELSIASEIINLVEKEIEKRGLKKLTEIGLRIGALSGIDPEALKFSYKIASANTNLDSARLAIEWVTVKGKCLACRKSFEVIDFAFICPYCDSADIEITGGEELDIISLTEQ
jgi:hydrogenase nickel incorporation protein HypA/HybF